MMNLVSGVNFARFLAAGFMAQRLNKQAQGYFSEI